MRGLLRAALSGSFALGAGLVIACSSSSSPSPTIAGTWHVTVTSLDSGSLSPSTFDAVVKATGDTYTVTLPTLTWSVGPMAFDTAPEVLHWLSVSGKTVFGADEATRTITTCRAALGVPSPVEFLGELNANLDAMSNGTIAIVLDTATVSGTPVCKATVNGTISAHK